MLELGVTLQGIFFFSSTYLKNISIIFYLNTAIELRTKKQNKT